jgi:hypothetical protein
MAVTAVAFCVVSAGLGAALPCGDGLAGLVLVSSGPAQQPGDGQGDHHGPGEGDADPAGGWWTWRQPAPAT